MGSRLGQRASKGACLVVPPLFRADSGTNLIKQGENVKGRPCVSVAQLAEFSHGKREALGSSPGRATIFSSPVTFLDSSPGRATIPPPPPPPVTFGGSVWVRGWGNEHQKVHVSLFRADSGTTLIRQGESVKARPLAQRLSCLTDSERPWVRVPAGPRFFPPL